KLFPEGSMTPESKAKPEIWQKWPEFDADAKKLQTLSEQLRDAAKSKNSAATEAIMKDFGREACGACHQPFRVPPPARTRPTPSDEPPPGRVSSRRSPRLSARIPAAAPPPHGRPRTGLHRVAAHRPRRPDARR